MRTAEQPRRSRSWRAGTLAALAATAALLAVSATAGAQETPGASQVTPVTYESLAMDADRQVQVYTPPGYRESGARYPTLYLLGGAGDDNRGWLEKGNARAILDQAMFSGDVEPMVVVMIDARGYYSGSLQTDLITQDRFVVDFAGGIIPAIEDEFNVRGTAEGRALAGLSLGGVETLDTLIRRPRLASQYAAWSIGWFPGPLADLAENHKAWLASARINSRVDYFEFRTGVSDPFYALAAATRRLLEDNGIDHAYSETPGRHEWAVWSSYLTDVLPNLFGKSIRGIGSDKCVDIAGANTADATAVQVFECNRTKAQRWRFRGDGTVRALGKCLDVSGAGNADGTRVQLYACNGTGAQQWRLSGATLVNPASGRCLDATDRRTDDRAPLQIWSCHGGENQRWRVS